MSTMFTMTVLTPFPFPSTWNVWRSLLHLSNDRTTIKKYKTI